MVWCQESPEKEKAWCLTVRRKEWCGVGNLGERESEVLES
jgi:hypothetical protein